MRRCPRWEALPFRRGASAHHNSAPVPAVIAGNRMRCASPNADRISKLMYPNTRSAPNAAIGNADNVATHQSARSAPREAERRS